MQCITTGQDSTAGRNKTGIVMPVSPPPAPPAAPALPGGHCGLSGTQQSDKDPPWAISPRMQPLWPAAEGSGSGFWGSRQTGFETPSTLGSTGCWTATCDMWMMFRWGIQSSERCISSIAFPLCLFYFIVFTYCSRGFKTDLGRLYCYFFTLVVRASYLILMWPGFEESITVFSVL